LFACDGVKGVLRDEDIPDVPMLILANKTDKHPSATEEEIRDVFNLRTLTTGKVVQAFLMVF